MILLIPLGGRGDRFKKLGYKKPKPLINVMGKPIITWLFDHLDLNSITMVIIPYNRELEKYCFEEFMTKTYPKINFRFVKIPYQTQGAAETVWYALNTLASDMRDCPILCLDGDNFYLNNIVQQWKNGNSVFFYQDDSGKECFSFITMNDQNHLLDIAEKERISSYACTGAYGFESYMILKKYCQEIMKQNLKQKNEYYLSGVVKLMITHDYLFYGQSVSTNDYVCLGTPLDVRLFCNNYPKISANNGHETIKTQRYCFDLDNTLVTYPKIDGDYSSVQPIQHNIDFLKYLKKIGHTIIIYTARRMKTHHGNLGSVMADIGKITFETLVKFDIPYDEIYFGKPYADYYIDDAAISVYDDLEKEIGYYRSNIDTRSFNNIVGDVIYIYKKYGKDLSGEIYWYEHIPNSIKDMFPLYFGSDGHQYTMERINGIPFSRLLLSQDLTIEQLKHIINSIHRIHQTPIPETEPKINIYQNYIPKLRERYENYDYKQFRNSDKIYQLICNQLDEYERNSYGQLAIIHGDSVFTNIMINQFGKIKFIDMRGKVGSTLTITGDKYYDWAKLYQSLLGYDEILENKQITIQYKNTLIEYFENRFVSDFGEKLFHYLKYLTCSLLFSLIPLHDNQKCQKYYQLICQILDLAI